MRGVKTDISSAPLKTSDLSVSTEIYMNPLNTVNTVQGAAFTAQGLTVLLSQPKASRCCFHTPTLPQAVLHLVPTFICLMPHLFCNQANLFPPYTPPLAGVKAMLSTEEVTSATAHTRQLAISCRLRQHHTPPPFSYRGHYGCIQGQRVPLLLLI